MHVFNSTPFKYVELLTDSPANCAEDQDEGVSSMVAGQHNQTRTFHYKRHANCCKNKHRMSESEGSPYDPQHSLDANCESVQSTLALSMLKGTSSHNAALNTMALII
jgi:hypothetical protein